MSSYLQFVIGSAGLLAFVVPPENPLIGWIKGNSYPIDIGIAILAAAVALAMPKSFASLALRGGRYLRAASRRRGWTMLGVFIAALAARAVLLPVLPVPNPSIHDEFSYLLAADTIAHGRLTNPTPPFWQHFETFHVNVVPTYHSIYPIAQGLVMGAAQALTGEPFYGVLLSVALMCAALFWALCGWLPRRWALLGALLVIARYCIGHYWDNSYWGGAVAALGGALVLGAAGRLTHRLRLRDAAVFGAGTAILMNSRPYEGLLLCAPIVAGLLVRCARNRCIPAFITRVAAPIGLVILVTGGAMLFYSAKTTGNPLQLPYTLNLQRYHVTRPFIWDHAYPVPTYHNSAMRDFYLGFATASEVQPGWRAHVARMLDPVRLVRVIYATTFPFLVPFFLGIAACWHRPRTRILVITVTAFSLGLILVAWPTEEHYVAPVMPAALLICLLGIRSIMNIRRIRPSTTRAWAAALLVFAVLVHLGASASAIRNRVVAAYPENWWDARHRIEKQLTAAGGKHLVFVQYGAMHDPAHEYVQNAADIANAPVIWVRELHDASDAALAQYYRERQIWVIDGDEEIPVLRRYVPASARTDISAMVSASPSQLSY